MKDDVVQVNWEIDVLGLKFFLRNMICCSKM